MFKTGIGPFNGKSWEGLCQQVFKLKYGSEGYQPIVADPGDFGLEGFTIHSGLGFQCYCPEKHYTSADLYIAQRDKITRDLAKLKTYQNEIAARIGATRIGDWIFVTPVVDKNLLLKHAKTKEQEVNNWKLPILKDNFCIHLRDADFYLKEINEVRALEGYALSFDAEPPTLAELNGPHEEYESNLKRKSALRLASKETAPAFNRLVDTLLSHTMESFLQGDGLLRRIENDAPTLYFRLLRLVNEYEKYVHEVAITWDGTPEELTSHVKQGLEQRITSQLKPTIDETTSSQIARHIVARWLAVCQLDFE